MYTSTQYVVTMSVFYGDKPIDSSCNSASSRRRMKGNDTGAGGQPPASNNPFAGVSMTGGVSTSANPFRQAFCDDVDPDASPTVHIAF